MLSMLNKTVLAAIALSLLAADTLGRDPYPNKERLKHIIAPKSAEDADPATMLRPDGRRSDIISFSCVFRGRQTVVHYLNDAAVDTLEKAKAICDRQYPGYAEIRKPYLKNNKNVRPGEERYDAHGSDWPIGPYLGKHTSYPGWMWATPSKPSTRGAGATSRRETIAPCWLWTIRTSRRSPSRGLGGECLTIRASATSR
jgi:hypothetical protein